jgi:hypothetical protein
MFDREIWPRFVGALFVAAGILSMLWALRWFGFLPNL